MRRGPYDKVTTLIERRMASGHYHRRNPHVVARLVVETVTAFARHIYRDVEPPAFDLGEARADVVSTRSRAGCSRSCGASCPLLIEGR